MIRSKRHWHKDTKKLCKAIDAGYEFPADQLQVLYSTLENHHTFTKASEQLEAEELTVMGPNGMTRKNPLCEIIKNAWGQFLAGCRHLKICQDIEPRRQVGRPGRQVG